MGVKAHDSLGGPECRTLTPRSRGLAATAWWCWSRKTGLTFEAAAAASNVAKSTVHLWVSRWRAASPAEQSTLACLGDRSSRPRRSPTQLSGTDHDRVCEVRERTGWGPRLIASEVGLAHATVHRALARRGCSRVPRAPREDAHRYEWPCPGNLLHMDTKRHARFERP